MAMLMMHMAISGIVIMAIMAIMVISVMANGIFWMAIRGIQLKGTTKTSSVVLKSLQLDLSFRHYQHFCDFVIFTPFVQCRSANFLRKISQKLVHPMTNNF